ncbi:23S rRNA (uracil(1939)-C(5))-methyltransferase RlmD [Sedimentibacter sp. zth1]|uniref:23S rRNA (uracil(1939)-C(5))-methyltransferase RlmD n=1 Tax=Sedimentibacter sp. zth1 TaxID=2816908 RepID=UPI001A92F93B|nr:23S rRNA (uracil(1939)-C(5))-methyltransferase RlmD [Sedimentibacter sp. zth1]QSX05584.1 23S rRNA (uracil(1939)-C(5))-methyltransferase RlmD [Sedimentibacter sp. zth1]
MRKGDIIQITIENVLFPNKAVGKYEDYTVIVKNALLGQTVNVKVSKIKKHEIEAKLFEVVKQADFEQEAICEHFGICGGCLYQTIPYQKQTELKQNQVKNIIDEVTTDYEMLPIIESPRKTEYRNKMEFSFGDAVKGGPLTLGLHRKNRFYEIVTVDKCQIVDNDFRVILDKVLEYFQSISETFYHKMRKIGFLRHLVVRKCAKSGDILLNLVTSSQGNLDREKFVEAIMSLELEGQIKCIAHSITDSVADVVKADQMHIIYGEDKIEEEILGLKFNISAFSFFQTNSLGAEELYSVVRDFIGETKDKVIYDLYSGTGTIGQIVSTNAKKVIGIEIVEEAVKKANENVLLNDIGNCIFIAGDVLEKVGELTQIDGANKPDIIVLDPPREGIHPKALKKIIDYKPETFIYISCKPTSMTKDLPEFLNAGYKVKKVRCVDMFPMTPHVEAVVLMSRVELLMENK